MAIKLVALISVSGVKLIQVVISELFFIKYELFIVYNILVNELVPGELYHAKQG